MNLKTTVGRYTISTVLLPFPEAAGCFETMVFDIEKTGFVDLDRENYQTQEIAEKGHAAMVEKWRERDE